MEVGGGRWAVGADLIDDLRLMIFEVGSERGGCVLITNYCLQPEGDDSRDRPRMQRHKRGTCTGESP
jgi:hypothetical protein